MFGNPETTTGGNALKFYSSVRLDIRRVTTIKDGDQPIGNQVRVKVVKNKVAPPFRKAEFEITFGEGISHIGEIVDLGTELGIIKKSGSWFSYGETKIGQGRDAVKRILKDNPELCEEIEAQITESAQKTSRRPKKHRWRKQCTTISSIPCKPQRLHGIFFPQAVHSVPPRRTRTLCPKQPSIMKKFLLLAVLSLTLAGCSKS